MKAVQILDQKEQFSHGTTVIRNLRLSGEWPVKDYIRRIC